MWDSQGVPHAAQRGCEPNRDPAPATLTGLICDKKPTTSFVLWHRQSAGRH